MPNRFSSLATIFAACATVALTSAAQALASNGHAAKLSPPVIHEPFTPMPCTGSPGNRTTLQEEGCAEQQILRSDKQIDTLNQKIFTALHTTSARRDLLAGHRAWLVYRKSYCLSVSDVFQGGTLAGVVDADCTATVNTQHVSNLKTFLKDLTSSHG
ncbi:MAG: lysozyme inhibitor LprI family protein [Solirubrobacteraceae bacterium]